MNSRRTPERDSALLAAMKLLRAAERTEAEVRRRLLGRGYSEAEIDAALAHVRAKGYLDDRRVVERAVERSTDERPVGRARIEHDLASRGVDTDIVQEALDGVDTGVELAKAQKLLVAKYPRGAAFERAARFLASRGFEEDVVREAISTVLGVEQEGGHE